MRITDWKLGVRLGLAFGLMLVLALLIAALGMFRIAALKSNSEELATTELERQALVEEWFTDIEMNWLRTEALLKTGNGAYAQQLRQQMAAVGEIQSRRMELVKGHLRTEEEQRLYRLAIEARDRFRATRAQLITAQAAAEEVSGRTDTELQPVFKAYEAALTRLGAARGQMETVNRLRQRLADFQQRLREEEALSKTRRM